MAYLLSVLGMILFSTSALADSTTVRRQDGGSSSIGTSPTRGTTVTVSDKTGKIVCTKTFGETDHKAAVKKYANVKC